MLRAGDLSSSYQKASRAWLLEEIKPTTTHIPTTITATKPPKCAVRNHNQTFIGPYVIKQSNEQKLLWNPQYSLKRVQIKIQTDVSTVKPECTPFINVALQV